MKRVKHLLPNDFTYLTVLFMGTVSTLGGGMWLIILSQTVRGIEYLNDG